MKRGTKCRSIDFCGSCSNTILWVEKIGGRAIVSGFDTGLDPVDLGEGGGDYLAYRIKPETGSLECEFNVRLEPDNVAVNAQLLPGDTLNVISTKLHGESG